MQPVHSYFDLRLHLKKGGSLRVTTLPVSNMLSPARSGRACHQRAPQGARSRLRALYPYSAYTFRFGELSVALRAV